MSGYMPKSKTDSWSTPKALYEELDKEFSFDTYDPCPLDDPEKDGLSEDWAAVTFCNPPYSQLKSTKVKLGWVDKHKAHLGHIRLMIRWGSGHRSAKN